MALLTELREAEARLPENAPRALLSVRLSVLTHDTTSPVRQELDLRMLARERGCRVVGVASDLQVSATKVPPWKRKELGLWLNDRVPEFDELLFWKLDRFVRRLSDLSTMIDWCLRYGKNLVSRNESIDLTSTAGKTMVSIIGGIAEIEAANTGTRVANLWDYARKQTDWVVGKPPFGYVTSDNGSGRPVLAIDPEANRALHWCLRAATREKPASARRMAKVLVRAGICGPGLTTTTLLRRLRNPGLMGYRVEEDKNGGVRRSKLVLGADGNPIRVAEPILSEEEFNTLQAALDRRSKKQPTRQPGGATMFLGVLRCADCDTTMTVHKTTNEFGSYQYLRCRNCRSGGVGAPNPAEVYEQLVSDVLSVLGDEPVQVREYARGTEARSIGPGTAQDRWMNVHMGKTFRERWEEGGMEAMAADLLRAGVRCEVTRTKVPKVRAPLVHLRLLVPKDVRSRLVIKEDAFAAAAGR